MKSLRRVFRFLQYAVLIVVLTLVVIVSGWVTMKLIVSGEEVPVPTLAGKTASEALKITQERGFNLRIESEEYHPAVPPGFVISQEPSPRTKLKKNRSVRVVLSLGAEKIVMPDLKGLTLRETEAMIRRLGLQLGKVSKTYSDDIREGRVVAHFPDFGGICRFGQNIDLLISLGANAREYIMPELSGKELARIRSMFDEMGVQPAHIKYESSSHLKPGVVIKQEPSAGSLVSVAEDVYLTVNGPDSATQAGEEYYLFTWVTPEGAPRNEVTILHLYNEEAREVFSRNCEQLERISVEVPWIENSSIEVRLNDRVVYRESL